MRPARCWALASAWSLLLPACDHARDDDLREDVGVPAASSAYSISSGGVKVNPVLCLDRPVAVVRLPEPPASPPE